MYIEEDEKRTEDKIEKTVLVQISSDNSRMLKRRRENGRCAKQTYASTSRTTLN